MIGKFLGTDTAYIAGGSFWLSLHKIASIGVAILLSVAYARYLPKETYGTYRYILSFIGIFGVFAISGMGTAIIRSVARGYAGTFRAGAKTIFLFSWGISVSCIAAAAYFYYADSSLSLAVGFLIAALFVPFSEGLGAWRSYYTATKQFRAGALFSSGVQITYGIVMLGGIAIMAVYPIPQVLHVPLLAGAYLAAHALPNIVLMQRLWHEIPPEAPADASALRYGFQLTASEIPNTIAHYLDSILLYSLLGPASIAIFSFATAPVEQIKALFGTAASVSMPKLAEKTSEESLTLLKQTLPGKLYRACALSAAIVAAYIITAPFLFQFLFPRYIESVPLTQVLALSLVFFPLGVFGTALKAEGNIKKIYMFSITSPLIQIAAIIALIPLYGLWGAVAARVAGRTIHHFFLAYLYYRH